MGEQESMTDTNKTSVRTKVLRAVGGAAGLGVIIGILGLIQSMTGFTFGLPASNPQGPGVVAPMSTTPSQNPLTESAGPRDDQTEVNRSPNTPTDTSLSREQSSSLPSVDQDLTNLDAVSSISVVSEMTTTTYGKVVGINLYQMANNFGHIQVAYGWTGLRVDGTEIDSETCQILVTIDGPQAIPAERYGQCTNLQTSFYKADDNKLKISVPGEYEVTVLDEKTGVSGTSSFTILSE